MSKPFTLPAEPVDGYEVVYFHVLGYADAPYIRRVRMVYHVNATWAAVCSDAMADGRYGADFVDDWQVFDGDRFVGRNDGWDVWRAIKWEDCFPTFEEAKAYAVLSMKSSLKSQKEKLTETRTNLRAMLGRQEGDPR